ncbi:C2H2 zinc finger [Ceratobasidium sp. AG-Ba]|nr:C2H2 zinc finger [Ceratobasidium sp. AG-Ba]QRW01592.1 C2H2 zinc finger [Ceratobasidium sp. AG-Ba]
MRIAETIDSGDEHLGLRLEDVVNDDSDGSEDVDVEQPPQLSSSSPHSIHPTDVIPDQGVPVLPQDSELSQQQQFDHAALEAQITDLITAEAARPASRAAAAAAAARQRSSNSRAVDTSKATTDPRSKSSGDPSSMSFPLSLAATQAYPLPPPPLGYPPQPSETESAGPDGTMPESDQHRATESHVLDPTGANASGQTQNFADITDILAHLSAHLEQHAAVAAGNPVSTQAIAVESSGAEDDDDSLHEGQEMDDEEEDGLQKVNVGQPVIPAREHEDFSRPYVCDIPNCGKGFGRKSDLARHLRIHSGERPYPCDQPGCGKSFIQRSALNVHKRVHTGEKPHTCEFAGCDKTFGDSSSLARHRRTHTGRRPYKCDNPSCEKTFTRRTTLNRHMRVHMPGFDPHSRPAKRRRTEDDYTDIPTIGSFITPPARLPGGIRPVPEMSNSALISLGPNAGGSGPNGQGAPESSQMELPSQAGAGSGGSLGGRGHHTGSPRNAATIPQQLDAEVYPEDWVQNIDGEGDSEEHMMARPPLTGPGTPIQPTPHTLSTQIVSN